MSQTSGLCLVALQRFSAGELSLREFVERTTKVQGLQVVAGIQQLAIPNNIRSRLRQIVYQPDIRLRSDDALVPALAQLTSVPVNLLRQALDERFGFKVDSQPAHSVDIQVRPNGRHTYDDPIDELISAQVDLKVSWSGLAGLLGVSSGTVSAWLGARSPIPPKRLEQLRELVSSPTPHY